MKLFSQIISCYCPCFATQASKAPPSKNDGHRAPPYSSAANSRPLNRGRSHWRPVLPNIMEDHGDVAEDHDNNVDKKSSVTWVSQDDHFVDRRRRSMPIIKMPPFSMF